MTGSAQAVLAFVLAAGLVAPVVAQQAETPAPAPGSVRPIDFRLPPATENDGRAPGVQGPSNNGIAPSGPGEARPAPAPPRVAPTQPAVQPPVQAPTSSRPSAPTATRPAATIPAPRDTTAAAAPRDANPAEEAAPAAALPTATDAAPGLSLTPTTEASEPTVDDAPAHDAARVPAPDSAMPIWGWLLALLAAGGAGYWYWRRRSVAADGPPVEPARPAAEAPAPQPAPRAVVPPPAPRPQPVAPARQPVLAGAAAGQPAPSPFVTRPAAEHRASVSIALEVVSIRMTPEHVVVGFALNLANQGPADATGLMVRIALNQGSAMPEAVLARFFDGAGGSVLRDDMELKVGAGEVIATEAMLPRAIVEPLMIGGKPMLVPVMAFDVTYHWESDDPDAFGQVAGSFVLGREQGMSGSEKLAPLPLDRASYAVDRPGARATAVRRSQ